MSQNFAEVFFHRQRHKADVVHKLDAVVAAENVAFVVVVVVDVVVDVDVVDVVDVVVVVVVEGREFRTHFLSDVFVAVEEVGSLAANELD